MADLEVIRGHGGFGDDEEHGEEFDRILAEAPLAKAPAERASVEPGAAGDGDDLDDPDDDDRDPAPVPAVGPRPRGYKAFALTAALAGSLIVGVIAGAAGTAPVAEPAATVTATATKTQWRRYRPPTQTVVVVNTDGSTSGTGVIEVSIDPGRPRMDGFWAVGNGVAPGTYEGRPAVTGGTCYWMRYQGQTMVELVEASTPTRVRIEEKDTQFASFGCLWYREV
ncbi:hypothetical protein [Aestuariimicrobium ganziense]|uniref:hypothetical protein n=1 Tax=Aestuariimicrobium ganziense TaxID=2773677 RepID=UPI0019416B9D|nr:hypothetical protein [Aestuariimicrobium ganziense]